MRVQISLWGGSFISFRYIPRNGIAGSYGSSIFNFWRKHHTVLHRSCTSLFPLIVNKGSRGWILSNNSLEAHLSLKFIVIMQSQSVRWDSKRLGRHVEPASGILERSGELLGTKGNQGEETVFSLLSELCLMFLGKNDGSNPERDLTYYSANSMPVKVTASMIVSLSKVTQPWACLRRRKYPSVWTALCMSNVSSVRDFWTLPVV